MRKKKASPRARFLWTALILLLTALLVPALRDGDRRLYLLSALCAGGLLLCMILPARLFSLDRLTFSLSLYLCALGVMALAPANPDAALLQLLRVLAGAACLTAGSLVLRALAPSPLTAGISSFLGLLLCVGGLIGRKGSLLLPGAVPLLLIIAFAALLCLRGSLAALLPVLCGTALLLLQGQTVEASLLALTALLLLWAADGRALPCLGAPAAVAALFFAMDRLGYLPALSVEEAHAVSLTALARSGLFGMEAFPAAAEPGLPDASLLYPLADHFGLAFVGLSLLLYLPLAIRGASAARWARSRWHAVLAMGCALLFALRVPAALLSACGILPLPLFPLPLLTASLPDLCTQMFTLGILCGIFSVNEAGLLEDEHLARLAH